MDSEMQVELWKSGPKDDGVEFEPIPMVKKENERAYLLAEQLKQLATYTVDEEKEKRKVARDVRVDE